MLDTVRLIIGTRAKATATFTDNNDAPADPTTVTAKTLDPDGTIVTYTYGVDAALTRTGLGIFVLEFDLNVEGLWQVRFAGTGAVTAAVEDGIYVPESDFV